MFTITLGIDGNPTAEERSALRLQIIAAVESALKARVRRAQFDSRFLETERKLGTKVSYH